MTEKGILFEPVSTYAVQTENHKDKLVLGYGDRTVDEVQKGLSVLRDIV